MDDNDESYIPPPEELVNFKLGRPATSMLPLDIMKQAMMHRLSLNCFNDLQYADYSGSPEFRKQLADFLTHEYGLPVDPNRLFLTNGISGGLDLICTLFCKAGDLVYFEEPSYFLAFKIMEDYGLNVQQIEMEHDGLNVDALEGLLKRGAIPKLLYVIPTCHNPTGRTMTLQKRKRLVQLSIDYNFLLVSDEVYQLLNFPGLSPPPPMFTFDTQGTVLSLGSFSKILAPGLRLGWMHGFPHVLKRFSDCGVIQSGGGFNPMVYGIIHSAIELGLLKKHLDWTRDILWTKADKLMQALETYLPSGTTFERPGGGYFILVKLPENLSALDLLTEAVANHRVQFLPGSRFAQSMSCYLRLSFAFYDPDDLLLGVQRLSEAIRSYQAKVHASSCAKT